MSKKNNRNTKGKYTNYLITREKQQEVDKKAKEERTTAKRLTNNVFDEIEALTINIEKEDRMDIVEKTSLRKLKKIFKKAHATETKED